MSAATAGGWDGSHVAGRGKEFKSRVTSEERKRRNKKVDLGMRQQAQEEDCRGAHWRRSDEEGENMGLQKTDGQSEAFESHKWKTKAIWKVQAKGRGLRGLCAGVGDRVCGRGGSGGESVTSVTDLEVTLFTARLTCLSVWWGKKKKRKAKQW